MDVRSPQYKNYAERTRVAGLRAIRSAPAMAPKLGFLESGAKVSDGRHGGLPPPFFSDPAENFFGR